MINKKIQWFQMSQRQRMSPFPNYLSMEAVTKEMRDVIGYAYDEVIMILENNNFWLFLDKKNHEYVGRKILDKVYKEPGMFARLVKKQKAFAKSFYAFLKKNNKPNTLSSLNSAKLAGLHQEFEKRYKQIYSHYFLILAIENYFFEYLRNYINERESDSKKSAYFLGQLITEPKAVWNKQETKDALKISIEILKKKKKLDDKEVVKLIKKHEKKWFWITRDYDDPILEFDDFVERIKAHLKSNPKKKLEKMEKEEQDLKQEFKLIVKNLNIDKKHARLFQTMREGIFYKEFRKSIVSKSLYYYDPILKEIARRGGLTLNQTRHLKTSEIKDMLVNSKDMSEELSERIKLSIFHVIKGRAMVYTEKDAKKYYNYFVKIDKSAKALYGTGVSAGIAKGPAKIVINPDAFDKVKKGDIIITLQATPVFTRVLSISAGLVCDGGPGITSHPATLAREAGIPGIIGARMATKILKDGEIVEVDGNEGVMRRI